MMTISDLSFHAPCPRLHLVVEWAMPGSTIPEVFWFWIFQTTTSTPSQSLRYKSIVLMRSQMKHLSIDPNAVGCSHTPHDIL